VLMHVGIRYITLPAESNTNQNLFENAFEIAEFEWMKLTQM